MPAAESAGASLLAPFPLAFGGGGGDYARGVAFDDDGNVYVTGRFVETVDFDPGPNVVERTSEGSDDAFIASYDTNGNLRYVVTIGTENQDYAEGVAVDQSGNVFTTGRLVGTADFDPNPASTENRTSVGQGDVFVASYDETGAFRFAFVIEATGSD